MYAIRSYYVTLGAGSMGKGIQQRDQLRLRDGSCLTASTNYTVSGDFIRDRLRLKDGSCKDLITVARDLFRDRLKLKDGSCQDIVTA